MATSVSESSVNTSELDAKIQECQSQIAMLQAQIDALEAENADLIKKIASASVEDAAAYRQQYNANKNRISSLNSEKSSWQNQLTQYLLSTSAERKVRTRLQTTATSLFLALLVVVSPSSPTVWCASFGSRIPMSYW